MLARHVYTVVFEFFILKKVKHTKEQIAEAKLKLKKFQDAVITIKDYSHQLFNLRGEYPWVCDPLRGLIDWTPSLKNLWVFFCHLTSRDCDDFAALAFFTLKEKFKNWTITEWCVIIDEKIENSHMITTASNKDVSIWYIFDNHQTLTSTEPNMKKYLQQYYNCGHQLAKYREAKAKYSQGK